MGARVQNTLAVILLLVLAAGPGLAKAEAPAAPAPAARPAPPAQEQCIHVLAGFPADNISARYQLFRLTQKLAQDAGPEFRAALARFGGDRISTDTPILSVVRGIANPVLRQAEPALVIGQIGYLIDFAHACSTAIAGQMESLRAFDAELAKPQFNATIDEDALFLRQILSDALHGQKAHEDAEYGPVVRAYDRALVATRDRIEFGLFDNKVNDLEALYSTDLDKRLARSNDLANKEMDRETLGNALATSKDMNENNKKQEKKRSLYTLFQILSGL